ncbi:Uncharacterised protein [Mycobacteroides abscessus]|nr:Uncharacterised protein [Mycobacteroides abscessus]
MSWLTQNGVTSRSTSPRTSPSSHSSRSDGAECAEGR